MNAEQQKAVKELNAALRKQNEGLDNLIAQLQREKKERV